MIPFGCGMFWSQSAKGWLGYFATMEDGHIVLLYEHVFKGVTPERAAKDIKAFCAEKGIRVPSIVAQPELFPSADSRGETVSETFARNGVPLIEGDDDRVNGWSRVRSWLEPRPPIFHVGPECRYFLKTFGTLLEDPKKPDEILNVPEAYPAHGLRFYLMSRPAPYESAPKPEPGPNTWGFALKHLREPPRNVIGSYLR